MSRKRIPSTSKLTRTGTVAYARKQKSDGSDGADEDDKEGDAPNDTVAEKAPEKAEKAEKAEDKREKPEDKPAEDAPKKKGQPKGFVSPADAITVVAATEGAARPKDDPGGRSRIETVTMPLTDHGEPPAMPKPPGAPEMPTSVAAARPRTDDTVENPTFMPNPREIPGGKPDDPAPAPGLVPRGDSRSMRRWGNKPEFALVYRVQTFVICRFGLVGTRGQWRVVEYPTSASASHAYAKECSHFVTEGFSDYRE